MRLETLALKGVGPFTEEARLDLRELPPGLVAIVGENGAGKTMLLEAAIAVLDRAFISRGDKAPLTDYCGDDRGAYIDATYLFEGRGQYRARLNMDGLKGGSEAVLEHVGADGRRKPLNDGKVSTFDVARAQIFPSREVLLASAFAAQNRRGSFVTLGKGERKDLFAALLGLEKYSEYAETCRRAAALLDVRRAELRTLIARLDTESNDTITDQIAAESNQLQAEIGTADVRAEQLTGEIAALEQQLLVAREKASAYAKAVSTLAEVQDRRRGLEADRDREIREIAGSDSVFERTRNSIITQRDRRTAAAEKAIAALVAIATLEQRRDRELAAVDVQQTADRKDRKDRIQNNRANLIDQADAIRAAVKEREALMQAKAEHERQRAGASASLRRATSELAAARAEVTQQAHVRDRLAQARRSAALLADVPCGGAGDFAACQFLRDARASHTAIAALEQQLQALETAEQLVEERTKAEAAADTAVAEIDLRIEACDQRITVIEVNALAGTAFKTLADRAAALDQAEQRIKELEQELAGLDVAAAVRRATVEADHQARLREREDALKTQTVERAAAVSEAHAEIADLETKHTTDVAAAAARRDVAVTALEQLAGELTIAEQAVAAARVDHDAVTETEHGLALARADQTQTQTTLARLQERARHLDDRRRSVLAKREERTLTAAALQVVDQDAIEWESLARAFGKDGLQVLEIDAAGPAVSAITNDLLQACFGARFTVELVTQQAKASGKGLKEVFDLKVWDAERPGDRDRDIADLSGGEQVILNEALMSAIAIYVNLRNECPIRTCFRDETTGALDPENATRYMLMLRRVLERGGFHQILFISHNADAAAMADVQVRVKDGAIAVEYAAFGAAA